jgi:ABC-type cobalt transport system substrate-binding protein
MLQNKPGNKKENDKIFFVCSFFNEKCMSEIQQVDDFAGSEETATEALQYLKIDYKPNVYNQLEFM